MYVFMYVCSIRRYSPCCIIYSHVSARPSLSLPHPHNMHPHIHTLYLSVITEPCILRKPNLPCNISIPPPPPVPLWPPSCLAIVSMPTIISNVCEPARVRACMCGEGGFRILFALFVAPLTAALLSEVGSDGYHAR